ncbi:hypothetical protein GQ42DRAFT_162634 [Ramicandelaber brevisporus]|nr:hypothetical protein GQ42DRAFT_162634 [Ramicandelaber brevisporus]
MRISSSFTVAAVASVLAASSVRAQLPPGVDLNKPDTVKSYINSVLPVIAKEISDMAGKLPANLMSSVRVGVDAMTSNIKEVVATETATEVLGVLVSQLSSEEAFLRTVANGGIPTIPTGIPGMPVGAISAGGPGNGDSNSSKDSSGGNSGAKGGDKSGNSSAATTAQLTFGAMAGVAAFAVFF